MSPQAFDLAFRTAMTAGPAAQALAEDYADIACSLRAGELDHALESFGACADRLQRFLTFVVVTSEMLMAGRPSLGAVVADYGRRLLRVAATVEAHLERNDLVGLTLALEHGLSTGLSEYESHADAVLTALSPTMAAA